MIVDILHFFPLKDLLLMAGMFMVFIFVAGSLLHYAESEWTYYKWSKEQAVKGPPKKSRVATKSIKTSRAKRPTRTLQKAKA